MTPRRLALQRDAAESVEGTSAAGIAGAAGQAVDEAVIGR